MTQPSLLEQKPIAQKKKKSRVELVAEYFQARPNLWIDGREIEAFAGHYGGWSARIRDARREFNLAIENRVRWVKGQHGHYKVSEYRLVQR